MCLLRAFKTHSPPVSLSSCSPNCCNALRSDGSSFLNFLIAKSFRTSFVLTDLAIKKLKKELPSERKALQQFGEQLNNETGGEWVLNALNKHIADGRVDLGGRRII